MERATPLTPGRERGTRASRRGDPRELRGEPDRALRPGADRDRVAPGGVSGLPRGAGRAAPHGSDRPRLARREEWLAERGAKRAARTAARHGHASCLRLRGGVAPALPRPTGTLGFEPGDSACRVRSTGGSRARRRVVCSLVSPGRAPDSHGQGGGVSAQAARGRALEAESATAGAASSPLERSPQPRAGSRRSVHASRARCSTWSWSPRRGTCPPRCA